MKHKELKATSSPAIVSSRSHHNTAAGNYRSEFTQNVHWLMGQGLSLSLPVSIRRGKNDFDHLGMLLPFMMACCGMFAVANLIFKQLFASFSILQHPEYSTYLFQWMSQVFRFDFQCFQFGNLLFDLWLFQDHIQRGSVLDR